ncbi:MAG: TolC family protein [Nitrospirae bacterium]|nr:TolC family protein [Nitrospirota bacterium]
MKFVQLQHSYVQIFIIGLWLFLFPSLSVFAAEPPLKLQALIEEAFQQNPEIQAAKQRWEAVKARVPQVQSLPDPVIGFGYRGPDIMREGRFQVQQEFPFPGKLGLKGTIASKAADQVNKAYKAIQLRVIAQMKIAYFNLHFIHKSIEVVSKNLVILKELEKTAEARYKVGKGIQQDVFRAQVELSREMERLTSLEQEQQSRTAELNRILNRPPTAPLGKPEEPTLTPLPYSLEELTKLVKRHSPTLQVQAHGIERSQSALALAQREYYPDFVVTLGAMQSFRSGDQTDAFGMFGIKVPLYYSTKQRYGEKEALATLEGSRKNYDTVLQDALFRVKDNFVRAKRAERLVKLIGKAIIPQASLALESSIAGYGVGKVNFLTMLDNVLNLQQDELDLHRQKTDHEISLAKIEEVIGQPLEEHAVSKD